MPTDLNNPSVAINPRALASLSKLLDDLRAKPFSRNPADWNLNQLVANKSAVIPRYGPMFSPANVAKLSRTTFLEFLEFDNNRHWYGLTRHGEKLTKDMGRLRNALALLVDESIPLKSRLDRLRPREGKAMLPYLGPAVITAVLHVVYPNRYAVCNETSKKAMGQLGIWPRDVPEDSFANQYLAANPIQLKLASALGTDLWTIDYLWWYLAPPRSPGPTTTEQEAKHAAAAIDRTLPPSSAGLQKHTQAGPSFAVPSGLTFSLVEAESRLVRFCREEYIYYDGIADQSPARIEPIDVLATVAVNSFVNNAVSIHNVHRGLARQCDSLLLKIPVDADLMSYDEPLTEFRQLIGAAVQAPQVLVAVATKVLHRKRRNFIVMIDSVLIKHYATAMKHPEWIEKSQVKMSAAEVAVEVMKAFREDLRHAYTRLIALRTRLAKAGFELTPLRILEILVWTETETNGYYRTV
jgi:hypothetical protein